MSKSSGFNIVVSMNSEKQIQDRLQINDDGEAVKFLRDDVYRLYQPYVPRDNGGLYRLVSYPNNHTIRHNSPYSHYQYKGILYLTKSGSSWAKKGEKKFSTKINLKHSVGGPEWDVRMMTNRRSEVEKDLENFIKNGGK
jgi:hypothetical protein